MQANIYEYLTNNSPKDILITKDDKHSKSVYHVASYLGYKPFVLPEFRANFGDDLRSYKEELTSILNTLREYYKNNSPKKILISPFRTLRYPLPTAEVFSELTIEFADTLPLSDFRQKLYYWGYEFVELVTVKGEVSFRGDIIDIFPINAKNPYRISLFDDEIEGIKTFDSTTQKSFKEEIGIFNIPPAMFALDASSHDKLTKSLLNIKSDSFSHDISSLGLWALEDKSIDFLSRFSTIMCEDITSIIDELLSIEEDEQLNIFKKIPTINEPKEFKDLSVSDVKSFIQYHKSKKITIIANNEALLKQADISDINLKVVSADYVVNLISNTDVIISLNKDITKKRKNRATIVLDELKVGNYIVHETHGVGIFKGLTNTKVLGSIRDFVEIAYQGDDRLLIPVENLETIDRYISDGGVTAIVDKLGKGSFLKLKEKTRKKLFEIAAKIIQIAAARELEKAPVITPNYSEIDHFQSEAGFTYTKDQSKTIDEIFESFKSGKTMDRLLSGDVGFGKTEVALNAIFATVKSGFQAAFIAPTTLLSHQHFKSLSERLNSHGITVARLDKFTKPKDKIALLQALKEGKIDVCIGTHSLFGVEFNNIALLVLDEEHKFGVKQKEKLKEFKENLHILSMSATPIPRSLNMALSSIKQYSQLQTPPLERKDVKTFVKEYNNKLIKEIILREKRRNGQIFYIHNNIASIEDKKKQLLELLPKLKILVLHSKVAATVTEKEMLAFENNKYDLLLSTSIIESGIHIPNVNTIVIEDSHKFGIADLHQLRGRVGRSSCEGFCFLIVPQKDTLTKDAKKRLLALESNSFLGSGALLAYHDLEIRGGGNLIGEAQSGHIKGIGYNLYLKMLEDAINTLLNKTKSSKKSVEVKLAVSAFINSETINEDRIRLELYRRLSSCKTPKEIYEIEEEMIDRFGTLDRYTQQFLQILVIKILSLNKNIKQVMSYEQNITIIYEDDKKEYLKSRSKDDDDILNTTLKFLRK